MLKILTFLGLGPEKGYKTTTYIKHDKSKSFQTHLFPDAVTNLYNPDQTIVFVTPKVEEDEKGYLKFLIEKLDSKLKVESIPDGNSENDLWDIFQKCADTVNENDKIILDITHAFRSIPLLIFIVAAYLRQVKNIQLKHIIYGAFEARNSEKNETPIFDLTPFVELLDWMNAVNVFQNYGDARPIASLNVDPKMKNTLNSLSDALLTSRTLAAQKAAMTFNGLPFGDSQQPPFQMLIDQLKQSYQQMAVHEPHKKKEPTLKEQYFQIKWYVENQHYLQAITLMREWLISWECRNGQGHWLSYSKRKKVEEMLKEQVENRDTQITQQLAQIAQQLNMDVTTIELWDQCVDIRNDLAHCGMRITPEPKSATDAIQGIQNLFNEFEKFVHKNNIA